MSLPYSSIVPVSAVVDTPAFTTEKKHMLLAVVSDLMPSTISHLTFQGSSAVSDFGKYFGKGGEEYKQVQKYFSFLSKAGNTPDKLVVANWYKEDTAAYVKGAPITVAVSDIAKVSDGSLEVSFDYNRREVAGIDFTGVNSFSDVADRLQAALQTDYAGSVVEYSSVTGGLIVRDGATGIESTVEWFGSGTTGTDVCEMLGLGTYSELSQGVQRETFADFCDRIYNANTSGYSITTLEALENEEMIDAVKWLQQSVGGQPYNTVVRLVFNLVGIYEIEYLSSTLQELNYSGYVLTYDPLGEYVNVLDCAICATIDYNVDNGAINFNFQPADGYTAATRFGTVLNYQSGMTNVALIDKLNTLKASCVYSVGFGAQEQTFYGFGYVGGDFGTEDVQVNESAFEQELQVNILNALSSVEKIKLQGKDADSMISSLIATPIEKYKQNGSIARNGTLTNADKIAITQATGDSSAAESVEQNGVYYKIMPRTEEDIKARQVRVMICYLAGGVVNKIRIINRIYGA
jgi:hypothetical protein